MVEESKSKKISKNNKAITILISAFLIGSVITAVIFMSSGFAVKNSDGVKQFISDQTEVERVALKLKQRFGNPASPEYREAMESYSLAVLASDKYIQEVKLEANLHQIIDETTEKYANSQSGVKKAFEEFINIGDELMGMSASGLELVNESSDFVFDLLGKIIELKDGESQKAVDRLEKTLNNAYMLEYSVLTRDRLIEKYRGK